MVYNISSLLESNLIKYIQEKLMPKSIVLFGSYSRGEDLEESDIDLFVECKKENIDVSGFERKLKRRIQMHFNSDFSGYPSDRKSVV